MFYTIYKITNKINSKIYIGKHQTKDLNDAYMGSGKLLKRAIDKYGIENFEKEILFQFDNETDMNTKETELVTEEFCLREDTYNLCPGGKGGFGFVNNNDLSNIGWKNNSKSNDHQIKGGKNSWSKYTEEEKTKRLEICKKFLTNKQGFKGKEHTEESKIKISLSNKGSKNSQFGKKWIHSLEHRISKRIDKNEPMPEGWILGRKMKFE